MKQLRLFLLLAAGLFLTSCSEPQPDEFPNPDPPPTVGRHAVPIDQALGELHDLLGVIDGQGTRAGGVRTVAQVQTLHAQALALTRSASEPGEQPEELLYVVNFEDDAGYAVLGADDRLPGVLAVRVTGSKRPLPASRHRPGTGKRLLRGCSATRITQARRPPLAKKARTAGPRWACSSSLFSASQTSGRSPPNTRP